GVKVLVNTTTSNGAPKQTTATVYDSSVGATYSNGVTSYGHAIGTINYYITANGSHAAGSTSAVATGSNSAYQGALFTAISGAMSFNQDIQDGREASNMNLSILDVSKLNSSYSTLTANGVNGTNIFNGVVYIADTTNYSTFTSAN